MNLEEKTMSTETHTETEEIVDDHVPVDAFLDNMGTHIPVPCPPEPPVDPKKEEKGKEMTSESKPAPKLKEGQVTARL